MRITILKAQLRLKLLLNMKKLVNYCPIIFFFLLAIPQARAQSVDVVIHEMEPSVKKASICQ
ncbi:hypothetical protein KGMB02408_35780 [Bacteroides faecalis]|uniref:Uncharacterized protein n=1 Tax=Bacteroides faecalis TaxID=2447885 RepID=A0A401LYQ5_9BACE|nr:hypothetical protein KGMB02408_35780 [Bacteroides faecalis]